MTIDLWAPQNIGIYHNTVRFPHYQSVVLTQQRLHISFLFNSEGCNFFPRFENKFDHARGKCSIGIRWSMKKRNISVDNKWRVLHKSKEEDTCWFMLLRPLITCWQLIFFSISLKINSQYFKKYWVVCSHWI